MGQLAELNEPVRLVYFKGNKRCEEVHPKHELMTTHCGRRTFVVNALTLGVPAEVVMKWTGHSDYDSMKPYIEIVDKLKASEMTKFNRD
jgi:integrase